MKFEGGARSEYESPEIIEFSQNEQKLYTLLIDQKREGPIDPRNFVDLYSEKTVEHDEAHVRKLEEKFEEERGANPTIGVWQKRGKLFEAIIKDQAELSEWLGENAHVRDTAKYDDYVNGVDGIVSFEEEGRQESHLALAIDVTRSDRHLSEKFDKIKHSIDTGNLSRIKYFESETMRGELRRIPRVVVGADRRTISDVSQLLLDFRMMQTHPASNRDDLSIESKESRREEFGKVREQLAEHPLQFQLLFEIKAQLEAFEAYAGSIGKQEAASAYEKILATIDKIIEDKMSTKRISEIKEKVERDDIYKLIIEKAKNFGK